MSFEISLSNVKSIAKNLKAELSERGFDVKYAHSLEILAKAFGFRNWNTFLATLSPHGSKEVSNGAVEEVGDSSFKTESEPLKVKDKREPFSYWRLMLSNDQPIAIEDRGYPNMRLFRPLSKAFYGGLRSSKKSRA